MKAGVNVKKEWRHSFVFFPQGNTENCVCDYTTPAETKQHMIAVVQSEA